MGFVDIRHVVIIGAGWFGCYLAYLLQDNYQVTLLERNSEIFDNSSYYNQNRLHLGYHYARCSKTRQLCLDGFREFMLQFGHLTDEIPDNVYAVSRDSLVDFDTYRAIYAHMQDKLHTFCYPNSGFSGIEGPLLRVKERVINSDRAKLFFQQHLGATRIIFNYNVTSVVNVENAVIINDDLSADLCFDATYNRLGLAPEQYVYEKTLSLVYQRPRKLTNFGALTVMDGEMPSVYPRDLSRSLYTLTHVRYTPLIRTADAAVADSYQPSEGEIDARKLGMEREIKRYLPEFDEEFKYQDYFLAFKTKRVSQSDNRDCCIYRDGRVVTVNCGKIVGIFRLRDYIRDTLGLSL